MKLHLVLRFCLLVFILSCGKDPVDTPTQPPTTTTPPTEKPVNDIDFPEFMPPTGLRQGVTTNFSVSSLTDKAGKEISPSVLVFQGSATIQNLGNGDFSITPSAAGTVSIRITYVSTANDTYSSETESRDFSLDVAEAELMINQESIAAFQAEELADLNRNEERTFLYADHFPGVPASDLDVQQTIDPLQFCKIEDITENGVVIGKKMIFDQNVERDLEFKAVIKLELTQKSTGKTETVDLTVPDGVEYDLENNFEGVWEELKNIVDVTLFSIERTNDSGQVIELVPRENISNWPSTGAKFYTGFSNYDGEPTERANRLELVPQKVFYAANAQIAKVNPSFPPYEIVNTPEESTNGRNYIIFGTASDLEDVGYSGGTTEDAKYLGFSFTVNADSSTTDLDFSLAYIKKDRNEGSLVNELPNIEATHWEEIIQVLLDKSADVDGYPTSILSTAEHTANGLDMMAKAVLMIKHHPDFINGEINQVSKDKAYEIAREVLEILKNEQAANNAGKQTASLIGKEVKGFHGKDIL